MQICGLQKLSLVDFPGKMAATIFTGGCNLRCPFCHNALLVTRLDETPSIPLPEVLEFLTSHRGWLDGVVLSGGEPLMQTDAADFLHEIRSMGFAVKLDTNGCYPQRLVDILAHHLVDYVAMDIKQSPEKYSDIVGIPSFSTEPLTESINLLKNSGIDYEFRTTIVREYHTKADIQAIGRWCQGAPHYYLQKFVDSGNLINGQGLHAALPEEMQEFADVAAPYFKEVNLRGVD